jgi:SAM-dependent methyltransferase
MPEHTDDHRHGPHACHHSHDGHGAADGRISAGHAERLLDPSRLVTQLGERDLARLLALRGDEDVIELGSGAGFYTDRIAALTTGTVYGLDIQPGMNEFYRERGLPGNVRLITGDVTHLDLPADSLDVACSISTWHESGGVIDLEGLARALRPAGRLVVVDWRKDDESLEKGPPLAIRFTKEEVAAILAPHFRVTGSENLGEHMFAVSAVRA